MLDARLDLATGEVRPDPDPRPFADVLTEFMGGRVHEAASAELHDLLGAVSRHRKKGSLALLITVEPPKGAVEGGPLTVAMSTVLKAPKGEVPATTYYLDRDGNPSRRDPRDGQMDLFDADPEVRQAALRTALRSDGYDPEAAADLAAALDAAGYRKQP